MSNPPNPQLNITTGAPVPVFTTVPDHILRHEISDEELDMLSQGEKDRANNIIWTSAGAIVGATPSTLSFFIKHAMGDKTPIDITDMVQMIIFFGGILLCVGMLLMLGDKSVSVKSLVTKIRNRTNARRN